MADQETVRLLKVILDELRAIRRLLEATPRPYATDIPSQIGTDDAHDFMPHPGPTGPEQPAHLKKES